MSLRFELLGEARLRTPDGAVRLERRTSAVMAYLALEGQAVKYRLAGWLWADSPELTARNNMRQLLRRLRNQSNLEIIVGDDRIQFAEGVSADAAEMQALAFASDHAKTLEFKGELLDGLEFDDCPDFEEWLSNAREGMVGLRRNASLGESERLEQLGDLVGALRFALEYLKLEPLSEEAYRRLMRLHLQAGDRGAALAVFERCREVLQKELAVAPLTETLELAQAIESGAFSAKPMPTKVVSLAPVRSSLLVGRESEWAALEAAWDAGRLIFVLGAAGAGKSFLVEEFVKHKGSYLRFEGRPGDANVPYSSVVRFYRRILELRPDIELEPWARSELARILPELGEPPASLNNDMDKLRFFEAALLTFSQATRGLGAIVIDDLQFFDAASSELGIYTLSKSYPFGSDQSVPPHIGLFRENELSEGALERLQQLEAAGIASLIALKPLAVEATAALLESLSIPEAAHLAEPLQRYTGGNPMFILETVRHLRETGQLERGWPGRLPPPGKVRPLIQRRLERLSKAALNLAQAAAVLQRDYHFDLLTQMLGLTSLEALPAWAELEAAQVMTAERFSHDLIFEAVAAGTLESVRRWLNRRAAEVLEAKNIRGARVAEHWLAGFETAQAIPHLLFAAQQAVVALRLDEAAGFYAQAADLLETQGDLEAAFDARSD